MNKGIVKTNSLNQKYLYILYLSFIPLLLKGIIYLLIGSPYAIILGLVISSVMLYTIHFARSLASKAIKVWSLLLISYGIIRFLLASVNLFIDSIESAIVYQLTFWYHLKSALYVLLGLYLIRRKHLKYHE